MKHTLSAEKVPHKLSEVEGAFANNLWLLMQALVSDVGIVYGQLEKFGAERLEESYTADGHVVKLTANVRTAEADALRSALADASSGRIEC